MVHWHNYRLMPVLGALLLALLAACSSPQATGPQGQPDGTTATLETVRVGYLPVIIYAPLYVGIERGYFADEGITFDLQPIRSGNDAVVQLAANNFDVAMGGANVGLFNAVNRGLEFRLVAGMHGEEPPIATPLIISANRTDELQTVADLAGKRVAVHAFGAAIEYWLNEALAQGGLTMDDIQLEEVRFPDMPVALENGAIDAAVLTEPLVTISADKGLVAVLSDDYIDGFYASYVYMNNEWLTANPERARKFLRGYLRAVRDLQGDYMTDDIAAAIAKYTDVPVPVLMRIATPIFDPDGAIPVGDLETLQRFYQARGQLEYDELIDVRTFIDTELTAAVAAELDATSQE